MPATYPKPLLPPGTPEPPGFPPGQGRRFSRRAGLVLLCTSLLALLALSSC